MDNLKSCPFCGCGEAGTKWHSGYWSVQCGYNHDCTPSEHCFQDWGEFETEKEAVEAWNRRADVIPVSHAKYNSEHCCSNCGEMALKSPKNGFGGIAYGRVYRTRKCCCICV